jgi:hypothetical protein
MKKLTTSALKHATKDRLAIVTTPTVYFSDLKGLINHHFPNKQFNSQSYTEVVPFPGDFEVAKNAYFSKLEEKRNAKEAERKAAAEAEYQKRRDDILGLRRWRNGETECYVVASYKWVTSDDLNWDKEDYDHKVFFDLDKANEYFDEVYKENEDFCEPGYRFYIELTQMQDCEKGETVDIPLSDRLKITSVDDICETYMQHSFAGGMRRESIEQELPEDAVIVTYRKGEWTYIQLAAPNTWTGDLHVDRGEYHEKDMVYRLSELNTHNDYHLLTNIIEELDLTRKDCEPYLSESDLDELFDEDDDE